ncbi:hypothetical protein Cni_G03234 [Canna indica]|uniref:Nucleotide-diphospho-sugar transferase domain-containing protein n=1 Tax=Canna indica TaxID=4628 RepID=A0AAQ3Q0Y9_9LILI|nr:hypothetical protein Cni_G03234 [Canna indica]
MVFPIAAAEPANSTSSSSSSSKDATNGTLPLLSSASPNLRLRRRRRRLNFKEMPCLLAGFGCVCLLFFFLDASIYSALNELQRLLLDQKLNRQLLPSNGSLDWPEIVIFAAPRPFSNAKRNLADARQDMAVRSWLALSPDVSVVLFGQHPSIFAFASSLGPRVTVESAIDFTFTGTPFFHSMVARSKAFHSGISVLIDPETILLPDFLSILHYAQAIKKDWFLVSKPNCISNFPFQLVDTGKHWLDEDGNMLEAEKLQEHLIQKHNWSPCSERLLMAWNNGDVPLHAGTLPPFIYREGLHNEWLVNEVLASEFRLVFDCSLVLSSFFPESLGQWSNDFSIDADSADEIVWWYKGNYQLPALYGSLSFQQNNYYKNLIKIVKCYGECYLIDQGEDSIYSFHRLDEHANYSRDSRPSVRTKLQLFTTFLHSWTDNKWKSCMKSIDALDVSHQSSIMKLRGSVSEMPLTLSLPFSLEPLLGAVADKNKSVVLAVAGENYKDMLMNWVCRLRHLSIKNFLVCALDSEIYRFSILQGLPVFKDPLSPSNISFNDCHFGTKCFQRVTKVKSRIVLQILRLGYNVLMSDVDVYWFNNPLPFLMLFGTGTLVAQSDEYNETGPINLPRRLNSGFYFVHSDLTTIAAMEMVVNHASTSELSEQPSFYDVLCGEGGVNRVGDSKCQEPKTNLTVVFLDRNLFPNGAYKGLWETHDVRSSCTKLGCFILHNNWISSRKRKFERQVVSGLWEYDPSSRMCLQSWHHIK